MTLRASAFRAVCAMLLAIWVANGTPGMAAAQGGSTADISVAISTEFAALTAAEWVQFETVITNHSTSVTLPLVAHLTIAGLEQGQHVDPEDWSPERTQFLSPLGVGETVRLAWWVHALFDGKFAAFVTVLPAQGSVPVANSGPLRLDVAPDNILPIEKVLPVVAAVPLFPLVLLFYVLLRMPRSSQQFGRLLSLVKSRGGVRR